jgi:hypothetical protein
MLTSLQHAKEKGAKIISVNPMPETGLFRFKNPQDLMHPLHLPRFLFGKGTQLSDLWLPVRINGDMAFLQGLMKAMLEAEDAVPGDGLRPRLHHPPHRGPGEADPPAPRGGLGRDRRVLGLGQAPDRGGRPDGDEGPQDHRLLVHGPHPAQERRGDDPGRHQLPPPAGQHRPAGRGPLPGPRPLERPGRPDDGDLGQAEGGIPGEAREGVPLPSARGSTASTSSRP